MQGATRSHKREADVHHSASTRGTPGQQSAELPCDWGTGEGGLAQGPPITWGLEVPPQAPRKPGHHQRAQPLPRGNVFLARRQEHVKHTLMPSGFFSLLNLCFCLEWMHGWFWAQDQGVERHLLGRLGGCRPQLELKQGNQPMRSRYFPSKTLP